MPQSSRVVLVTQVQVVDRTGRVEKTRSFKCTPHDVATRETDLKGEKMEVVATGETDLKGHKSEIVAIGKTDLEG